MSKVNVAFRSSQATGVDAYHRGLFGQAWSILQPLASRGDSVAQYYLGAMCHFGQGTSPDVSAAAQWYRCAAEQGVAGAQRNLGVLYEDGKGKRQDVRKAAKWYRRAAERGDALAQHNLAMLYSDGRGVDEDDAEATRLLALAAVQGDTLSQVALALRCQYGVGIACDPVVAYGWLCVATRRSPAGQERERSMWLRDVIGRKLSAESLAKAALCAARWRPGQPI